MTLSDRSPRLPDMHHPWRLLRAMPEWTLLFEPLDDGKLGRTDYDAKTITLDPDQLQRQRRCTIDHEIRHVERGPAARGSWWRARDEAATDQESARRLVTIEDLAEALAWSHNLPELAEELHVDEATVLVRLRHLHPSEQGYLRTRVEGWT